VIARAAPHDPGLVRRSGFVYRAISRPPLPTPTRSASGPSLTALCLSTGDSLTHAITAHGSASASPGLDPGLRASGGRRPAARDALPLAALAEAGGGAGAPQLTSLDVSGCELEPHSLAAALGVGCRGRTQLPCCQCCVCTNVC
jgi:hypothetical protein